MHISELLIPELQNETRLNKTFLQRVPEDKLEWAPHKKSMPMGALCTHIVGLYGAVSLTMNSDRFDLADVKPPEITPIKVLLPRLDELAEKAEKALKTDNASYWETWTAYQGDEVVMEMPRYTALRTIFLNQFPHHRAQLGVYLRLLDVAVPGTYGPSADEA